MFKKNMKKALALLVSVLLLCTAIPLSALLSVSADALAVFDFEDDQVPFSSNSPLAVESVDGSKVMLKPERQDNMATLNITGRDMLDQELQL